MLPCDEDGVLIRDGAVDVDADGRIRYVGTADAAPEDASRVPHRLPGLLMPGLVNTHCHSPMTVLRGQGEGLPLLRWLAEVIWPREALMTEDDVFWGMTLASAEMLRYGVTTSCEMYFRNEALAAAVQASGARCLITPAIVQAPWPWLGSLDEQLDRVVRFGDTHHEPAGRVRVGIAAHSAYTVPEPYLRQVAEVAQDRDRLLHLHVAETEHEGAEVSARHGGASVPRVLADLGVFRARVLAAHAVWLSDADIALLAEHEVAVAHCPGSNAKLGSGVARLGDLLAAGVTVGLGTDGPASNNDLDLWEEMRLATLLARLRAHDPTAVGARRALELATRCGAAALGLPDIGVLEPGRFADMVHVDVADPAFVPVVEDADLVAHLVFAAPRTAVRDVWVAGRQVVADGVCVTVDTDEARARVQQAAVRLARGV
ncbi:MAG: amidohydrolase [Actinobacteria bacterium]|nr:amidohydrolase [Actinomycetota bacterium]MBI3686521.1 amidohydrolase [Actinomycetota bacterium]